MTSQKTKEEHIGVQKFRRSKHYTIVIIKPVDIKNIKNAGIDFLNGSLIFRCINIDPTITTLIKHKP
jgi:predicted methyltransferase MtxX (methanogen marker protein 4)